MKQNNKGQKGLSLNKTTVTKLQKSQMKEVKGGTFLVMQIDGIGETCGYVCGDCMSITQRTFPANTF